MSGPDDRSRAGPGRRYRLLWLLCASLITAPAAPPAEAAVERIEIVERAPFAEGATFGAVGSYQRISGQLHFAVDPEHPSNADIVDLELAPRDQRGLVEFTADFILLRPTDLSRGNHRLLYEVNNRGNLGLDLYLCGWVRSRCGATS